MEFLDIENLKIIFWGRWVEKNKDVLEKYKDNNKYDYVILKSTTYKGYIAHYAQAISNEPLLFINKALKEKANEGVYINF